MIIKRDKIVKFCEDYLKVKDFEDYCVNGLQIEGKEDIKQIVTGVSFSEKLIKEAVKKKADMIVVHHGIFKSTISEIPKIDGNLKNRLKLILNKDINLCGFHLPLDAHPVIGNNISISKMIGLKNIKPFDIGFIGELSKSLELTKFVLHVNRGLDTNSYVVPAGPKKVKRVGVISGGASTRYKSAASLGADTYICGDIQEFLYQEIRESKINFINAGHYNTEKMGIKNLGNLIAKKFNIKVDFIDVPCDV